MKKISRSYVAIALSIVSAFIASMSFYLTQIRGPELTVVIGPKLDVVYDEVGNLGFYVPATFINLSNNTGTIVRVAMTVLREDTPQEIYYLEWLEFARVDPKTQTWELEGFAHTLVVRGKSTVAQMIRFLWYEQELKSLILREGSYVINFLYWEESFTKPKCQTQPN